MKPRRDSKATSLNCNYYERSIDNVLQLLEELFNIRLVEHLSMPVDQQRKLDVLTKFREKMNYLHALLSEIQKQGWIETETVSTKDKSRSKNGISTKLDTFQKDQINRVQMAYNDLFIQGSFKHYKKIAATFNLPSDLEVMDMTRWGANNKREQTSEADCCKKGRYRK